MTQFEKDNPRESASKKSASIRVKKILLLEPDKEQAELFAAWLKEESYEVELLFTLESAAAAVSKDKFDLLVMDIDVPEEADKRFDLYRTIREDVRAKDLPITVLTYGRDAKKIINAIEAGVDNFVLKPFKTGSFLERIKTIFREIELKKQGKKVLDLNYINYLIALMNDMEHENFFMFAQAIFNKLIVGKINTILGEPVIGQIIKRCDELVGEDYAFMKEVKFSGKLVVMDGVDKASKGTPVGKLTGAFRDYIYAFLQLVRVLTSDILMERGGDYGSERSKK